MYHYAANNPVRYTDPDGRADTVIISPGHGLDKEGHDRGTVIDGVSEVHYNWLFCKELYSALERVGISYQNVKAYIVENFGSAPTDFSPEKRVEAANNIDKKVDAFLELCIHCDANTKGFNGISLYYIAGADKSKKIAEYFHKKLQSKGYDVRIRPDSYSYVGRIKELHDTTAPALLIEIGSMDTKESRKILLDRMNGLANDLADIIKEFNKDKPNWQQ